MIEKTTKSDNFAPLTSSQMTKNTEQTKWKRKKTSGAKLSIKKTHIAFHTTRYIIMKCQSHKNLTACFHASHLHNYTKRLLITVKNGRYYGTHSVELTSTRTELSQAPWFDLLPLSLFPFFCEMCFCFTGRYWFRMIQTHFWTGMREALFAKGERVVHIISYISYHPSLLCHSHVALTSL